MKVLGTQMTIQLLVVDDHKAVQDALRLVFADTEIDIADKATTVETAVQKALEREFDVILLDLTLPDGDGFQVLERVKEKKVHQRVLMYSLRDESFWAKKSKSLGASGYLVKTSGAGKLIEAIRQIHLGNSVWEEPGSHKSLQVQRT